MTTTAHTPGPWTLDYECDITGIENDPENGCVGKFDVAHVYMSTAMGRTAANACLIVAAPDLLAALKDCVEDSEQAVIEYIKYIEKYGETHRPGRLLEMQNKLKNARSAIAKAEGGAA